MPYHPDDTICAIATAAGGAARGMVRISGPEAVTIIARLFEPDVGPPLASVRRPTAIAGRLRFNIDSPDKSVDSPPAATCRGGGLQLPCALYLWPTARSYTRQPVAEVHTLGSPPLLEALLAAVCGAGARLAEPGEFTLRAFLAGRLDLTQAEGVLGVIDAQGEQELRGAVAQLAGGLARPLHQLREELLQLLAELEAGLDFVDEDIEFVSAAEVERRLTAAKRTLGAVAQQMASRHATAPTMRIVLTGPPNAGKSSLFNALVARIRHADDHSQRQPTGALVSPQRGTTRDYLTARIELGGIACELLDTAGVDNLGASNVSAPPALPGDHRAALDQAAQSRAVEQCEQASIRVACIDASQPIDFQSARAANGHLVVLTKADVAPRAPRLADDLAAGVPVIITSSRTGEGLDALCSILRDLLVNEAPAQPGQVVAATADRCRESIRRAEAALQRGSRIAAAQHGDELLAAELRVALGELGKVVGAVYTEDLLDRIFSTFCIGK